MNKQVLPYEQDGNKKEEVKRMFDNISGKYDLLNDVLSLGMGRVWRTKAVNKLFEGNFIPERILDVASGTGDFAYLLHKKSKSLGRNASITGVDISEGMLNRAREKYMRYDDIKFVTGDAENLTYENCSFDAVTCSYGIRNFENPLKGLNEFHRVLKSSGRVVIVELSMPNEGIIKPMFKFYFNKILPWLGGTMAADKDAYNYLPNSVNAFPSGAEFVDMMKEAGFENPSYKHLFGGIATLYFAEKL